MYNSYVARSEVKSVYDFKSKFSQLSQLQGRNGLPFFALSYTYLNRLSTH